MRIEAVDKQGSRINRPIDRLVVYDRFNQAVLVVIEIADGAIFVARPDEKGFREGLEMLGIHQVLEVDVARSASGDRSRSVIERA